MGGATQAQQRAIFAIAKNQGLDLAEFLVPYHVRRVEELSVKDASKLIDELKAAAEGSARIPPDRRARSTTPNPRRTP